MKTISEKDILLINRYLLEKVSPYLIMLFGSAVKGTFNETSDIDIAFLSDITHNDYDLFIIGQGLADMIGKEVDLVDLKNASTVFQAQIFFTGREIFCNDINKKRLFQVLTYKKYAKLNEERKPILLKAERGLL
ncbi:hypothetical protein JCM14036_14890 [Desulfotomaculum defluvii]